MRTPPIVSLLVSALAFAACGGSPKPAPIEPTPVEPAPPAEPVVTPAEPTPPADPPPPEPAAKVLVQVDAQGLALGGHDPVAYAKQKQAIVGTADKTAMHAGAMYRFASAEHQAAFEAEPARHVPAYGGFCAYAASQNRLSQSDPKFFTLHDGQLLMFTNRDFLTRFQKDPAGHKQKADANWPGLLEQHGK